MKSNFERMMKLAEDVFAVKNDPEQLDVNEDVIEQLIAIHSATVSEHDEGEGPVAWVLVIPTTTELMNRFLKKEITEKQLFLLTQIEKHFETVYLCSALVLEEHRRKGITKQLAINAIEQIKVNHRIESLFVWSFSKEGELAAEKIAEQTKLELFKRN
jgi:GNAT superfamily N-acetyltransferase